MSGMNSYSGRQITNGGVTAPTINFTSTLTKYEGDTARVNKTSNAQVDEIDFIDFMDDLDTQNLNGSLDIEESIVYSNAEMAGATLCIGFTSALSGVLDIGEAIFDGGAWCTAKAV